MKVLLTGGTGYIGSHTAVELLNDNYEVIIIDNLINSKKEVTEKIEQISGKKVVFYEGDVRDKELLTKIFNEHKIDSVIHFAGLKAVGESVEKPLEYYDNNIGSTLALLETMNKFDCKKIVFSSSATVYGDPVKLPIKEDFPLSTTNPYGTTKLMIEMILKDLYKSDNDWRITLLRYFNPVGAHESNLIGEDPNGIPNNLMPYILKVAIKEYKELTIFGDNYDTKDGTGVRDYIHVVDLANGHVCALNYLNHNPGIEIINLGTGIGYSVLEMVETFKKVNNVEVPYIIGERRAGDIASCYADPEKAKKLLGFKCTKTLEEMCRDSYNFYKNKF